MTPETRYHLTGIYMGLLNGLGVRQKQQVKALYKREGIRAAIKLARQFRKERA